MFQFAQRRKLYYLISAAIIIPGILAMVISTIQNGSPVLLSIDFTGGTLMEVSFVENFDEQEIRDALNAYGLEDIVAQRLDPISTDNIEGVNDAAGSRWQIRTKEIQDIDDFRAHLRTTLGEFWSPQSVEDDPNREAAITTTSVSATVGQEVTRAALTATLAVAVVILGFIVFAFRRVPHAFRYGACAIIAMFHDILVTMGVMSILGLLFGWEADALFLTALLTVVGYSVQDKIVVFDRIRENSPKYRGEPFSTIANRSVLETLHRSLATQLNAIFIMVAILLFGGGTIKQFIAVMLVGLVSGTFSSIFNAVPVLVGWEEKDLLGAKTAQAA